MIAIALAFWFLLLVLSVLFATGGVLSWAAVFLVWVSPAVCVFLFFVWESIREKL